MQFLIWYWMYYNNIKKDRIFFFLRKSTKSTVTLLRRRAQEKDNIHSCNNSCLFSPDFYAIECITQEWSFFSYNHVITVLSWKTNFLDSFVLSFTYCVRKRFPIYIFYFLEVPLCSEMSIHFYLFNSFPLCFIDDWIF